MDAAAEGLALFTLSTLWTTWMLLQWDLLFAHSQPFGLHGCCCRGNCCFHIVSPLDYMDAAAEGLALFTLSALWTTWMLLQRALLFSHSQPFGLHGCCCSGTCCFHIVNPLDYMDAAAVGLAVCT